VTWNLTNKVVLITGAGSGIGAASARALGSKGAKLVLADLNGESVYGLARELGAERALGLAVDATDRTQLDSAVAAAVERFGGIDVVFANAGIAVDPPATVASVDEAAFERVIEVDLLGVWRTVRAALPQVIEHQGHVLLTASIYAFFNGVVNAPYAMSKAGVEQFGRALRAELAPHRATAGVLYPGWVRTPLTGAAFGGNRTATELVEHAYPALLRQQITPQRVADSVVRGLERRSARVIVPRRWTPISVLRGIANPIIDARLERDPEVQRLTLELERQSRDAA
jgi:NAD(P)-dependent dehydrogenase (short-subunit alcohol dehydrogenase family)